MYPTNFTKPHILKFRDYSLNLPHAIIYISLLDIGHSTQNLHNVMRWHNTKSHWNDHILFIDCDSYGNIFIDYHSFHGIRLENTSGGRSNILIYFWCYFAHHSIWCECVGDRCDVSLILVMLGWVEFIYSITSANSGNFSVSIDKSRLIYMALVCSTIYAFHLHC